MRLFFCAIYIHKKKPLTCKIFIPYRRKVFNFYVIWLCLKVVLFAIIPHLLMSILIFIYVLFTIDRYLYLHLIVLAVRTFGMIAKSTTFTNERWMLCDEYNILKAPWFRKIHSSRHNSPALEAFLSCKRIKKDFILNLLQIL